MADKKRAKKGKTKSKTKSKVEKVEKVEAEVVYDKGAYFEYWTSKEGLEIIKGFLLSDKTLESIAKDVLLISKTTFQTWCKRSPELNKLRILRKETMDALVDNALYKSCVGFYENGFYYPPNPKALALWYHNKEQKENNLLLENNKPQINVTIKYDDGRSEEITNLDKDIPKDEILNVED